MKHNAEITCSDCGQPVPEDTIHVEGAGPIGEVFPWIQRLAPGETHKLRVTCSRCWEPGTEHNIGLRSYAL